MPGRGGRLPTIIEHMAARIHKERGVPPLAALQIAISRAQQIGILRKKSLQLTQKGRIMSQKHYRDKAAMDLRLFKRLLRKSIK